MKPQASVIVPSIGRTAEAARLLDSLCRQTCPDFQVVLVDQNADDRLVPLVEQFGALIPIQHIRSKTVGASRARNAGLADCVGEVILWPDDDSWYPHDLVERVLTFFEIHPGAAGTIGILVDETGKAHTRWVPPAVQPVGLMDAFTQAAEPVLFFRRTFVEELGGFDDSIGTGAQTPWGAGEGADLCARALKAALQVWIDPGLRVFHAPTIIQLDDPDQLAKARTYARGMGAVVRKNRLPALFIASYLFTYLRAVLWNLLRGRWANVNYHHKRLVGVIEGMLPQR
jgi:glycosyltransferase involved in cell wall biosynthesis